MRVMQQDHRINDIRLVAIDVDGTLLNSRQELPESAAHMVREVLARGVKVSIVSGRPRCGIRAYLEALSLKDPDISSGGAHIYDPQQGRVLAHMPVPRLAAKAVVHRSREYGVAIFFESPEQILYEGDPSILEHTPSVPREVLRRAKDILSEEGASEPGKITLVGEPEMLLRLAEDLGALPFPVHCTSSGPRFLEVTRAGVNKGSALRRLAAYLGIPDTSILAIGDSHNDVSMFQFAGRSVAMGNAPLEVRASADLLAPSHDSDGLAWVLRKEILEGRA